MSQSHSQIASFIWSICNLLRGPYKRNEYRKVILSLTVIRHFDCILESIKDKVLEAIPLLDDTENIAIKLQSFINGFFQNVVKIIEYFSFWEQIVRLQESKLLYMVLQSSYEIPLNCHFYVYQPSLFLDLIGAQLKTIETENADLLEGL
ncbi:MAG: type I restriction-modification system subunit M N-terminal domain-containing protein [Candidatus Cloacimonetes bacterium]|jgi:type I restriction enzyme M protein|nr:type I restriction-modification system subunit M N-terminal domain-containing protein [Candidatus Cloacimonadota bacterium]